MLSRKQLAALLAGAPERYRLLLELIAGAGLHVSEAIALQRRHLVLDGDEPLVRVRRAIVKRRARAPKTKHGRRDVRISTTLAAKLAALLDSTPGTPETLVFATSNGAPLDPQHPHAR